MFNRTLPGNDQNFSRTTDRDFYWQEILRFPHTTKYSKSCDCDSLPGMGPQIICGKCGRPMLVMESVRGDVNLKETTYSVRWGKDSFAPVFAVSHNGVWVPEVDYHATCKTDFMKAWAFRKPSTFFVVQPRFPKDGDDLLFTGEDAEEGFVSWVESVMWQHVCKLD